jgi:hypothetical protein
MSKGPSFECRPLLLPDDPKSAAFGWKTIHRFLMHRRGDNPTHREHRRAGHNCRRNVSLFRDVLPKIERR